MNGQNDIVRLLIYSTNSNNNDSSGLNRIRSLVNFYAPFFLKKENK